MTTRDFGEQDFVSWNGVSHYKLKRMNLAFYGIRLSQTLIFAPYSKSYFLSKLSGEKIPGPLSLCNDVHCTI